MVMVQLHINNKPSRGPLGHVERPNAAQKGRMTGDKKYNLN